MAVSKSPRRQTAPELVVVVEEEKRQSKDDADDGQWGLSSPP